METVDQIISIIVLWLFYLDCTATYWSLSVVERFNASALYMEQNRIARWVFGNIGIKAGYIIWLMFVTSILSLIIYYISLSNAIEILWALFAIGIIIAQIHQFNYWHIRKNRKYHKMMDEIGIRQVKL